MKSQTTRIKDCDAFPSTDWGHVDALKKAQGQGTEDLELLTVLAGRYWSPIYQLLRWQGVPEMDAMDLTQDFFAFALESRLFAKADQQRGRLRSFLLASLKHFAAKARRRDEAGKRCPPGGVTSLEALLEDEYFHPASLIECGTLETRFHRAWLHEVVVNVLRNLEEELEAGGKQTHYELFRVRVVAPALEGTDPPPLEKQAKELGLKSKEAANQITTAKRAFKRILAREVKAYAMSQPDSNEELGEILHLLRIDQ